MRNGSGRSGGGGSTASSRKTKPAPGTEQMMSATFNWVRQTWTRGAPAWGLLLPPLMCSSCAARCGADAGTTGSSIPAASTTQQAGSAAVDTSVEGPSEGCPAGMARVEGGKQRTRRKAPRVIKTMCVDLTEVTVQSYAACVAEGVCQKPDSRETDSGGACNWGVSGRELHPVNCIDKNSAETYCQQKGARLPSFNEWRWVAEGGETGNGYPWGNDPPADQACWSGVVKRSGTCPVGSFSKGDSAQGIHDLSGNVDEWTTTEFFVTPGDLLLLGGNWLHDRPDALKTIAAEHDSPDGRYHTYGFRCIKVVSPPVPRPSESSDGCPEDMLIVEGGELKARRKVPSAIKTMCVDRFEVTVESYAECVTKGACQEPKTGGACNWGVPGRAWHPINCVDLDSAKAYCAYKNARLPASDEWEWVAGGRDAATLYPWGNYPPSLEVWWSGRVERSSTGEVGFFVDGDSPQGISDLSGNVSEWTSTIFSKSLDTFVVRGGSWESNRQDPLRTDNMGHQSRRSSHHAIGFRCVTER